MARIRSWPERVKTVDGIYFEKIDPNIKNLNILLDRIKVFAKILSSSMRL